MLFLVWRLQTYVEFIGRIMVLVPVVLCHFFGQNQVGAVNVGKVWPISDIPSVESTGCVATFMVVRVVAFFKATFIIIFLSVFGVLFCFFRFRFASVII